MYLDAGETTSAVCNGILSFLKLRTDHNHAGLTERRYYGTLEWSLGERYSVKSAEIKRWHAYEYRIARYIRQYVGII